MVVSLERYSRSKKELQQIDQRTIKVINKALHPRNDRDRLYVLWKENCSGLAGIEDSVDALTRELEDYI